MEILIITLIISSIPVTIGTDRRICWFTSNTFGPVSVQHIEILENYGDELDYDTGLIHGTNQTCSKTTNYCYALWREVQRNNSGSRIMVIAQGCWETSGKQDCENMSCITSRKPPKALNDTNFCCCKGNFCNGNMTQLYFPDDVEVSPVPGGKLVGKSHTLLVIFVLVFLILVVSCLPVLILLARGLVDNKSKKMNFHSDPIHLLENKPTRDPKFTFENIILEEIIGQGRYGTVWSASMKGERVAVKIFQSHYKNYFYNELDIYCTPYMSHPCLLSYLGYDERVGIDGNSEYMLFLSLVPNGNVQDFLASNVVDWNTFCKMSLSIARGIAHLHSDIRRGGKFKPCVSHRDLNTKNILVREDLTCVICDLSFATKTTAFKYYCNGDEQSAKIKSINDVGTLRYMSPEILDGAVNLRDCETALKQIDIYALGLILWEISTRCKDFYPPGRECVPYRLPFEAELGHPSFGQMQLLVCKHKARPLFPDSWKDSSVVRSVKETIEDCWDQDAEARLTALCVEERFHELSAMSERQKVSFFTSTGMSLPIRTSSLRIDSQNVFIVTERKEESRSLESIKDAVTTDHHTPTNIKNSNESRENRFSHSVQPHQGRNPCLERNLMSLNDCDSNSGNFIDKSLKSTSTNPDEKFNSDHCSFSELTGSFLEERTLEMVRNQSDPVPRTNAPIPRLQNVKLERSLRFPKLSNLSSTRAMAGQSNVMGWKDWKKIFLKKDKIDMLSTQIDCDLKTNLIRDENLGDLSSPVGHAATKLETRVLFHNGKPETKINDETCMKSLKIGRPVRIMETEMEFFSCSNASRKLENERPVTSSTIERIDSSIAISSMSSDKERNLINKFSPSDDLCSVDRCDLLGSNDVKKSTMPSTSYQSDKLACNITKDTVSYPSILNETILQKPVLEGFFFSGRPSSSSLNDDTIMSRSSEDANKLVNISSHRQPFLHKSYENIAFNERI